MKNPLNWKKWKRKDGCIVWTAQVGLFTLEVERRKPYVEPGTLPDGTPHCGHKAYRYVARVIGGSDFENSYGDNEESPITDLETAKEAAIHSAVGNADLIMIRLRQV